MKIYDILNLEMFCEELTKVINMSIDHGGDAGGPYFTCEDKLIKDIYFFLLYLGIEKKVRIIYNDGYIELKVKR